MSHRSASDHQDLQRLARELDLAIHRHQVSLIRHTQAKGIPAVSLSLTDVDDGYIVRGATSAASRAGAERALSWANSLSLSAGSPSSRLDGQRSSSAAPGFLGDAWDVVAQGHAAAAKIVPREQIVPDYKAAVCANCGNIYMEDARFCRKCGVRRPGVWGSDMERQSFVRWAPTIPRGGGATRRRCHPAVRRRL